LFVCPFVTNLHHENMALETTTLGFKKCKMQKLSILLLDFAKILEVPWTATETIMTAQMTQNSNLMVQPCLDCLKAMQATNQTVVST